jgi:hypothetical protein
MGEQTVREVKNAVFLGPLILAMVALVVLQAVEQQTHQVQPETMVAVEAVEQVVPVLAPQGELVV